MSGNEDGKRPQEGFVARWARLKRGEAETAVTASEPPQPSAAAEAGRSAHAEAGGGGSTAADEDTGFTLPSLDDLKPDGDIKAFLDKRVPEELRRMAMRRMWTLDPAIRDFIEIAENQYDWNKADGVPGFGPLPEGTDIDALLAQATGAMPRAAEDPAVAAAPGPDADGANASGRDADVVAAVASSPGEPGSSGDEQIHRERADERTFEIEHAQVADGGATDAGQRAPMNEAGPTSADSVRSGAQPLLRRRHGGALPA